MDAKRIEMRSPRQRAAHLASSVFSLIVLGSITGCDEIISRFESNYYRGTMTGYKKCIERNKGQVLKANIVENFCQEQNQVLIPTDWEGQAKYYPSNNAELFLRDECRFDGLIKNKSQIYVVTSYTVAVTHKDSRNENGNFIEDRKTFHAWIDPGEDHYFSIADLKFNPKNEKLGKGNFSWGITNVMGLEIKLK